MDQRQIVVETGLEERAGVVTNADGVVVVDDAGLPIPRTRHARTRFVEASKPVEMRLPMLGDPWCALTVRARLQRWMWVRSRDPNPAPRREGSCMPEVVREAWKDAAIGTRLRIPVTTVDSDAANEVETLLAPFLNEVDFPIILAIAANISDRETARALRTSHPTVRSRKQAMLGTLAQHFNDAGSSPDLNDIHRVAQFMHRKI